MNVQAHIVSLLDFYGLTDMPAAFRKVKDCIYLDLEIQTVS